jgi:hypothetical protein
MKAMVKWSTNMVVVLAVGAASLIGTIFVDTLQATEVVAADWAEGSLLEIKGIKKSSEQDEHPGRRSDSVDKVELVMQGGPTLRLAPSVKIRRDGVLIPLEQLPTQSRIRYSPSKGLVTEVVLLDLLAR